ncbi:GTPase HflX [Magnetovibrio sp.]|uniref:GTPase HflX n=1 Tax=Magnetovibrio sp. TaxID=2024836 RepID=UPI002F94F8CD
MSSHSVGGSDGSGGETDDDDKMIDDALGEDGDDFARDDLAREGYGHEDFARGERCLVIHPYLKSAARKSDGAGARAPEARLAEIVGLAEAIELNIVATEVVALSGLKPGTFFGKGTMERLGTIINGRDVGVVIIDTQLGPVQQRNLERAWNCKVLDRTGIILEIFGERARTKEGRLQVDLAHMTYQRSRLVRSWTHLERQRGGAGFMGGPGETQIEVDRRLIDQRIDKLKRLLKDVKRTRELHRKARRKVPYPIVALVGYTNAGKSTLFNRLTSSDVFVKDQLFATLDPTMRTLALPSGKNIILSDTVGFISDLPHELVEAFHATLEEVLEAQVIVHVRDMSHPDTEAQKADVDVVLKSLGLDDEKISRTQIEVRNKCDLLDAEEHELQSNIARRADSPVVLISAVTGEGVDQFLNLLEGQLSQNEETLSVVLKAHEGKLQSWLYTHGEVLDRVDDEHGVHLTVRLEPANARRFEQLQAKS